MIIFCCINLSAMCNLALKRFFFREKSDVSAVPMQYLLNPQGFTRKPHIISAIGDSILPFRLSSMTAKLSLIHISEPTRPY